MAAELFLFFLHLFFLFQLLLLLLNFRISTYSDLEPECKTNVKGSNHLCLTRHKATAEGFVFW
jgi:hypothetical protein